MKTFKITYKGKDAYVKHWNTETGIMLISDTPDMKGLKKADIEEVSASCAFNNFEVDKDDNE